MIDRGDLSRYVPIEKIPIAQENIIKNLIGYNSNIKYEMSRYKKITINTDKLSKFKSIKTIIKRVFNN